MTDEPFDIQAIEDALVEAAGVALVQPELYWIGDEEGQIDAFDDTGLRNTVFVHKDTQTRDSTIAYTDPTKNVKQYTLDMPVRVIPCYDTVRGKRIEWQIIGADVKLATIRPDSDPSIGSGGNVIAHSHQDTDEGGQLDATYIFNGGRVPAQYGGTNNDLINNPPADGALFLWNESQYRLEPAYFDEGGFLVGEQATTPSTLKPLSNDETISSYLDGVHRWRRVKNNYSATTNPTVTDDETEGYWKGSIIFNTENQTLWFCKDPAEGNAVWVVWTLGLGKNNVSIDAPTVDDDETQGYQINSLWFKTDTKALYICWDATEGAALWEEVGGGAGVLNNFTAVSNPAPSDDETEGYAENSVWYNTLDLRLFKAVSVVEDDAVWMEIGSYSQVATKAINNTTSTTYSIDPTNYFLTVDATSNNITVDLPGATSVRGRQFIIKRKDNTGNTVTIDPTGTETIDGSATYSLSSQYQSVTLFSDGTEWWVIATA